MQTAHPESPTQEWRIKSQKRQLAYITFVILISFGLLIWFICDAAVKSRGGNVPAVMVFAATIVACVALSFLCVYWLRTMREYKDAVRNESEHVEMA